MATMRSILEKQMIKAMVAKSITCPMTEKVLDSRTCLVVKDKEGDPIQVLDPSVAENEATMNRLRSAGWTVEKNGRVL